MEISTDTKLLLFDCNSICHISRHSSGSVSDKNIIYGFFSILLRVKERFPDHIPIFIWDGEKPNLHRTKLFPGYKSNRRNNKSLQDLEDDLIAREVFLKIRTRILPYLKIRNNFYFDEYEADDLLHTISEKYTSVMITRDKDMYQSLSPTTTIFDPVTNKLMTKEIFENKYGITPKQFAEVKSICGCPSDTVPGIRGVGEASAIKYIKGTLPKSSKYYKLIIENSEIVEETRKLVTLPYTNAPTPVIHREKYSFPNFVKLCKKFKYRVFLTRLDTWEKLIFSKN